MGGALAPPLLTMGLIILIVACIFCSNFLIVFLIGAAACLGISKAFQTVAPVIIAVEQKVRNLFPDENPDAKEKEFTRGQNIACLIGYLTAFIGCIVWIAYLVNKHC